MQPSHSCLLAMVALAACSNAGVSRAPVRAAVACDWRWTAPETLLFHGASFAAGGLGATLPSPIGSSLFITGGRVSIFGESQIDWHRLLGFTVSARGVVDSVLKPPFMPDVTTSVWAAPAARGAVHLVWKTFPDRPISVVHAVFNGTRWSAPDTAFTASDELMLGARSVATVGDDVIVALPTTDSALSGIVVGTRVAGRWEVSRFKVEHASIVELPVAVAIDESGATVVYVRPTPWHPTTPPGGGPPGLYIRHRSLRGTWGPEVTVRLGDGYGVDALRTADGTFHVFWRGAKADSAVLWHATTHDFAQWKVDQLPTPKDVQSMSVTAEGDGARIVMLQSDDPNGINVSYSRLVSFAWRPTGFTTLDTLPFTGALGAPAVIPINADTSVFTWEGQRTATMTTNNPGKGPSRWTSIVPVTMLARRVRECRG